MKSSNKLPLFYKDKQGKWQIFPIQDFEQHEGRWWLTYISRSEPSNGLIQFIANLGDKLEYSPCSDSYYLKED